MKKSVSIILAVFILVSCILTASPSAMAADRASTSRAIAIVFDNSGSMYEQGNQAWCRATYAMEVFASMLNEGDTLQIYPMWPIEVGGKTYTMESPLQINDAAKASTIRDIFTADASGTPIESIDCAAAGLQQLQADKKYMIVLTDGGTFSKNGSGLTKDRTRKELDDRVAAYAGPDMTVMYLGVGSDACIPTTEPTDYFVKNQAVNTEDVLSSLTEMCNQVFGRDILPKSHISGNAIEFDISMSKIIVFVQGENISNLKVTGDSAGALVSSQQTKYSTKGAGDYKSVPDTSLQGMMVTYADFPAGSYNIEYTGKATSVEVYYEPDADLDFVFTDAEGNLVDPNALYEGNYKVSFGMKDAKTGELISSDLLGNPKYEGSYFIDGQETPISHEGFSGSVDIPLKMGEKFKAILTAKYLSGYTITKDSSDFGWPEDGIEVAAMPGGDLKLEISGGEDIYSLKNLESGEPYIAKVYYQGEQLTGEELEKVEFKWDEQTSNALIKKEFAQDHWKLSLHYKEDGAPSEDICGVCSVLITACYSAQGSSESQAQCPLSYKIKDDSTSLKMKINAPETYFLIRELEESQPIVVSLELDGAPLSAEDFQAVTLQVDCGGIEHTVTPNEQDSTYTIKLMPTKGIDEGNYNIKATALHKDKLGRETKVEESLKVTLSNMPLWVRRVITISLLLLLALLIFLILRKPTMPRRVRPFTEDCSLRVGGRDVTDDATFYTNLSGKQITAYVEYNGEQLGNVAVNQLTPGKGAFLSKPSHKRPILVKDPTNNVRVLSGEVSNIDMAGIEYKMNPNGDMMLVDDQQGHYNITHGSAITMSGKTMIAGQLKNFSTEIPLNFKK